MKPKKLLETLATYFTQKPVDMPAMMIWGAPGIGKSDIVKQAAAKAFINTTVELRLRGMDYDHFVKDIRLLLCDPVDLRGLPAIQADRAIWLPPTFLPKEDRDMRKGVVFLDEIPSAPPMVQTAAHSLVLDRRVGEYKVLDGWFILGAGNRRTDKALVYEMLDPLRTRFVEVELEIDQEEWKDWAYANSIRHEVISFLNFRPSMLLDLDATSKAKATPRTWAMVSSLLNAGFTDELLRELVKGTVGEGAAAEFYGFLMLFTKIPNPDDILRGQNIVPEEPSMLYALCGALVDRYSKAAKKWAKRLLTYSQKLPDEFSVLLVKDAIRASNEITQTAEFQDWAHTYGVLIL